MLHLLLAYRWSFVNFEACNRYGCHSGYLGASLQENVKVSKTLQGTILEYLRLCDCVGTVN